MSGDRLLVIPILKKKKTKHRTLFFHNYFPLILVENERKVASAKVLTSCKRKFNDAIETNDRNFEGWNNRLIGEQLPNELDQHLHTFRSGKKQKLDLINPDFVRPFSNENGTKLETFRNFGEL